MRAEQLILSIFASKKLCIGRKVNSYNLPHYAYTLPLAPMRYDKLTINHKRVSIDLQNLIE
jgi:hypothetical protein